MQQFAEQLFHYMNIGLARLHGIFRREIKITPLAVPDPLLK